MKREPKERYKYCLCYGTGSQWLLIPAEENRVDILNLNMGASLGRPSFLIYNHLQFCGNSLVGLEYWKWVWQLSLENARDNPSFNGRIQIFG